jgi:hypothetical protein
MHLGIDCALTLVNQRFQNDGHLFRHKVGDPTSRFNGSGGQWIVPAEEVYLADVKLPEPGATMLKN